MKRFLAVFALFLTVHIGGVASNVLTDIPADMQITNYDLEAVRVIQQVDGKGLLEITDSLLVSEHVAQETKDLIQDKQRRIFLFEYPSDGLQIKGYVSFVPSCEKQPLLVFLRGGAEIYSINHPAHKSSFMKDYTVIATTYRGGVSPGKDEFGGKDVNDVNALVEFIPQLEKLLGQTFSNKEKYLLGWSRGGMEMFLALAQFPNLQTYFDKAVSMSGLLDLKQFLNDRPDACMMLEHGLGFSLVPKLVKKRNPIRYVKAIKTKIPLLILQGSDDKMISPKVGHAMLKTLKKRGHKVDYIEVEGGDHCLYNTPNSLDLVSDWLES